MRSRASPRFVLEVGVGECLPVSVAGKQLGRRAASRLLFEIDVGQRLPLASRTVKQASVSSIIQGGGKRRGASGGEERGGSAAECTTGHARGGAGPSTGRARRSLATTARCHQPVCGVANNWLAVWAASVMSVPPWPSAAVTKLAPCAPFGLWHILQMLCR